MINTTLGFSIEKSLVAMDHKRLINQLWKTIPMRENEEDWKGQLQSVVLELIGLNTIFKEELDYLILLSKLQGILNNHIEFKIYRKTIFEALTLLGGLLKDE